MECAKLKKIYEKLKSERKTVENTWNLIERFVVPLRGGDFFETTDQETAVRWRRRDIYDSTAIMACQSLAASIHGSLTSSVTIWFDFVFSEEALNEDHAAKVWLEECRDRVWNALQSSNFNLAAPELYLDLCSFGTGIFVEESLTDDDDEFQELVFDAVPAKEGFFEEDHNGQAYMFFRRLMWQPSQVISKFGQENVPESVIKKHQGNSDEKIEICYAVYPREDKQDADITRPLTPTERPYGWKYFIVADASMLEEGGYYEMPVYIPRWLKTSASRWGHSPAHISLADILTLNRLVELILNAAEIAIDPPWAAPERGLVSDLDTRAGGLTIMKDPQKLVALESRGRFDVSQLQRENLQKSIRENFHMDQLELKESPAMTATEVQVRYELMQRLLGPTQGRLESDFLDKLLTRTFRILLRAGRLPDPPPAVAGKEMNIEYIGPLARAQKADVAQSVERWIGTMAATMEVFPEVRDIIDIDKVGRGTATLRGVPTDYLNDTATVEGIRRQRAQQEQARQQLEMLQQGGEAAEALGKANVAFQQ